VLYFFLARPAVTEILHRKYDQDFKSDLVAHITAFCLNGIQAFNQEK
jgi:nuclear transport factor 2 (NTF2) superfamily protein